MMAIPFRLEWTRALAMAAWIALPLIGLWRRRGAGAVLFDLGGRDRPLLVVGCLIGSVAIARFSFDRRELLAFFAILAMGIGMIALGSRRFQLREAGFWRAGKLIAYDEIEAYEISETGSLSLKTPGETLKSYCKVPPALRSKTKELLASKCPSLQSKA
jgi:hypothetical protein